MNCEPGDLAISVGGDIKEHIGTIVEVLRASLDSRWSEEWVILSQGKEWLAFDKWLRPIRPSEGQDETLSWKSVPQPSKEKV
jgi:hypothetical protein